MDTIILLFVLFLFLIQYFCIRKYDKKMNDIKEKELLEYKRRYFTLRDLLYPEE